MMPIAAAAFGAGCGGEDLEVFDGGPKKGDAG
jgi:hypothetical protein